jgi:hypothetical protein
VIAPNQPDQALESGALARAVAPEQGHDFILRDAERHVEEDVAVAVIAVDAVDLEERAHSAATPPR